MIAFIAIPIFLLVFGGLFIVLLTFHMTTALLVYGAISLLFIVSSHKQLKKAKLFRTQWLALKARNASPDELWEIAWRKFLVNTGIFLAAWTASLTFVGIYYTVFLSVKAGGSSAAMLAIFFPMIVGYSVVVGMASATFGCLFAWLWVRVSPLVAMLTTWAPFVIIASMALTVIIHLTALPSITL